MTLTGINKEENYGRYRGSFRISTEELSRMFNLQNKQAMITTSTYDPTRDIMTFFIEGSEANEITHPTGETQSVWESDSLVVLKNMKENINQYLDDRIQYYENKDKIEHYPKVNAGHTEEGPIEYYNK